MGNRPGAHGAGLQSHPQVAILQPFAAAQRQCVCQDKHLGMMQRTAVPPHAVLCQRNDSALCVRDRGGDRHLAGSRGGGGLVKQHSHDIGAWIADRHDRLVAQQAWFGKATICQAPRLRVTPAA